MARTLAAVVAAGLLTSAATTAGGTPVRTPAAGMSASSGSAAPAYSLPLADPASVLRPFTAPATPYAAGNRGVDLVAAAGAVVLAAGSGTVSFAGPVAGRGVVVITHPDGVSTEYEPVAAQVTIGQLVARGDPIGHVSGDRAACASISCLHWGARRDGAYVDPLSLLVALGEVRLVAW